MVGVNVVAADTDEEARRLFTTVQQSFTNLVRGAGGKLQAPIDNIDDYWTAAGEASRLTHAEVFDRRLARDCAQESWKTLSR